MTRSRRAPARAAAVLALGLALPLALVQAGCETRDLRSSLSTHVEDLTTREVTGDDYQQMIVVCHLAGFQRLDFDRALERHAAALAEFEQGRTAQARQAAADALAEAKAAGNEKKVRSAEAKFADADEKYWKARGKLRAEVMKVLSLQQQRDWAGYLLYHKTIGRFDKVALGEGQKTDARQLANEAAAEVVEEKTVRSDPYLKVLDGTELQDKLAETVTRKVLNIPQRRQMRGE